MFEIDLAALREAGSAPGNDPRQWVSFGIVADDTPNQKAVFFNDDDGSPLKQGVLVVVNLQPSGISVPCRVLMQSAGSGEGDWPGYGPGDEVLVVVPEGDERAGCTIIGRLSNQFDTFPTTVGGMDTTNNSIAFKRTKLPYVLESASSLMLRQALTGASLAFDPTGAIFLNSGDKHLLSLNSSVITLQEGTGTAMLQIDPAKKTAGLFAGATQFVADQNNSLLLTPGTIGIGGSGVAPLDHATTIEAVANLFGALLAVIGAFPTTGDAFAAAITAYANLGVASIATLLQTTSTAATDPVVAAAIAAAFATPKAPGFPNVGCPGVLLG